LSPSHFNNEWFGAEISGAVTHWQRFVFKLGKYQGENQDFLDLLGQNER